MTAGTEHNREPDSDLVSIIMPTYNCGAFIAETIATVQAQTHPRWELLVVDDCSTDDTADVVGALAKDDPRIRYVRLETNSGATWPSWTPTTCGTPTSSGARSTS